MKIILKHSYHVFFLLFLYKYKTILSKVLKEKLFKTFKFYFLGLSFRDTRAQSLVNNVIYKECCVLCWENFGKNQRYRLFTVERVTEVVHELYIYDAEMNNSVVEKINNRVRTSRMRQTTSSSIKLKMILNEAASIIT